MKVRSLPTAISERHAVVAELADAPEQSGVALRIRLSLQAEKRAGGPVESQGVCPRCLFDSSPLICCAELTDTEGSSKGRTWGMRFSQGLNVQDGPSQGSATIAASATGYVVGAFEGISN